MKSVLVFSCQSLKIAVGGCFFYFFIFIIYFFNTNYLPKSYTREICLTKVCDLEWQLSLIDRGDTQIECTAEMMREAAELQSVGALQ